MERIEITFLIITILMALAVGSFLNVCIYRTPRKEMLKNSRSYCPNCGFKIKWYDNIPILSYIFLRGKCRSCKNVISARYPLVEALNLLLWLAVFFMYRKSYIIIIYCILVSVLIVMMGIDLDTKEIPDRIHIVIIILALLSFIPGIYPKGYDIVWQDKLIGMFAVSVPMFIVAILTGGMGLGDIKLYFVLGFLFGWKNILLIFLLSVILGSIFAIALIIKNKKSALKMEMPFGPYIALATFIAMFLGPEIIKYYSKLFTI